MKRKIQTSGTTSRSENNGERMIEARQRDAFAPQDIKLLCKRG